MVKQHGQLEELKMVWAGAANIQLGQPGNQPPPRLTATVQQKYRAAGWFAHEKWPCPSWSEMNNGNDQVNLSPSQASLSPLEGSLRTAAGRAVGSRVMGGGGAGEL